MSIPPIPGPNRAEPPGPLPPSPSLMVVDDTPANLSLLEAILTEEGYRVRCFPQGAMALAAAPQSPPDLVLLDVAMPVLDGYEICSRLRALPGLAGVPVIFLSAHGDTTNKVRGFRCGGVDYVTKPFEAEELIARVRTHLELRRLHFELRRQNAHLDELVRQRTDELARAHARLSILDRTKTDFLRLIAHELRTPLHGLLGVGEMLADLCPDTPGHQPLREAFGYSRDRILTTLDDALLLAQIEVDADRFRAGVVRLEDLLRDGAEQAATFARAREVGLEPIPPAPTPVRADRELCAKALRSLLETAVRFAGAGSSVRMAVPADQPPGTLHLEARGSVVPPSALPRFFEVLAIPEAIVPGGDLGLAAPLADRILALFDARVHIENTDPAGIRFVVRFATAEPGELAAPPATASRP
jgi:two-component system sensor histidine kinase/response regulator